MTHPNEALVLSVPESAHTRHKKAAHRRPSALTFLLIELLPFAFFAFMFAKNYHVLYLPIPSAAAEWLYIHADFGAAIYFVLILCWLRSDDIRRSFQGSVFWWTIFCLTPVGLFMLLVFSQRRPIISMIMLWCLVVFNSILQITESERPRQARRDAKKRHRILAAVFLAAMIVPSFLSVFSYHMLEERIEFSRVVSEAYGDVMLNRIHEEVYDRSEIYSRHEELFSALRSWSNLDIQSRQDAVTELAALECELQRIPGTLSEIKFITMDDPGTLGYYNDHTICLAVGILNDYSPERMLDTVLHEFYHHYQKTVCDLIDAGIGWDSPIVSEEMRLWHVNNAFYLSVDRAGMDGYSSQPVEVSARTFASEESARLMEAANDP